MLSDLAFARRPFETGFEIPQSMLSAFSPPCLPNHEITKAFSDGNTSLGSLKTASPSAGKVMPLSVISFLTLLLKNRSI
jgi:hypothetical protein